MINQDSAIITAWAYGDLSRPHAVITKAVAEGGSTRTTIDIRESGAVITLPLTDADAQSIARDHYGESLFFVIDYDDSRRFRGYLDKIVVSQKEDGSKIVTLTIPDYAVVVEKRAEQRRAELRKALETS